MRLLVAVKEFDSEFGQLNIGVKFSSFLIDLSNIYFISILGLIVTLSNKK